MVKNGKIAPEKKCPRVPVWVRGGCNCYLGNAHIEVGTNWKVLPLKVMSHRCHAMECLEMPRSSFVNRWYYHWYPNIPRTGPSWTLLGSKSGNGGHSRSCQRNFEVSLSTSDSDRILNSIMIYMRMVVQSPVSRACRCDPQQRGLWDDPTLS